MKSSACKDQITVLTTRGPLLTKVWRADGTVKGHDQAKQHTAAVFQLDSIHDLAEVLGRIQKQAHSCVIRGEYIGLEAACLVPDPNGERQGALILRQAKYFTDPGHYWIMFDVDGYKPLLADPTTEPEDAIREWVRYCLPPEFLEITCYWQLSSSAGHPSKEGELRAHVWFWMARPMTSPEARAYVTVKKLPVDRAPMNVVQAHYTAGPVMEPGVVDPVPVRAGLLEGLFGDEVDVQISEGELAAGVASLRAHVPGETDLDLVDPRKKKGLIGAFCRVFSVEEVLMAEWFMGAFERVTDRRYTWLDGNGAAEGAYVTDDGFKLVNTHNTAPLDTIGKGLNAWDLVRVYNFGHLDEEVPEDDRWAWDDDLAARPSEAAMRAWAKTLPEVQAELEVGDDASNPFVQDAAPGVPTAAVGDVEPIADAETLTDDQWGKVLGKKMAANLSALGVSDDEVRSMVDSKALRAAWSGSFYNSDKNKLYLLNKAGDMVSFAQPRWQKMIGSTFGKLLVPEVLKDVSKRLALETNTPEVDVRDSLVKAAWTQFENHMVLYRQRGELRFEVDMFASKSRVVVDQHQAAVIYAHTPFSVAPSGLSSEDEDAIVAEYRAFFPFIDDLLRMLLAARFASDRRQAFLWMHCPASWGKGFLFEGVLGRDGLQLFCELSVKDIERAFEGGPVGVNVSELIRAWGIWIDEFKSVKGEIKMLNNKVTLAPKGQMRVTMPTYLKGFTSAEGVASLAGSEGVEAQFADRFSLYEARGSVNELPLFKKHGKAAYRAVMARFAAEVLNRGVDEMRALGIHEATRRADVMVSEFHAKYGIAQTYGRLQDRLPELADEVRELIVEWARMKSGMPARSGLDALKRDLKDQLAQSVSTFVGARHAAEAQTTPGMLVSVRRVVGLVQAWIGATFDRSEIAMMSHKAVEIAELLTGTPRGAVVRHYVHQEDRDQAHPVKVKDGLLLELLTPAEFAERNAEFQGEDKVTPIREARRKA